MKAFVIAAPHSGSGKTTITIGLMEVLRRRGLSVAPFKVGPDFIDPGYHRMVTHRPSINLDAWMCGAEGVLNSFDRYSRGTDIAVVEGAMGLFDGFGGRSEMGSTAQVSKLTDAPVILVIDGRGQSRSVAALVKGFAEYDRNLAIAGLIFNNVSSDNHASILRDAILVLDPNLPVLGCVPHDPRLAIPSRHLGLVSADDTPPQIAYLEYLAAVIREHVDLASLWALALSRFEDQGIVLAEQEPTLPDVKIGVARDEAFSFVYEENLRLLSQAGAELIPFSPLRDSGIPEGVTGVYLPGGYPELFAEQLAGNESMKCAIATAVAGGMPMYAECGGFIYLTKGLVEPQGPVEATHKFAGVFPVVTRMLNRRKSLGYREIELISDTCIGGKKLIARGHEFHYSEISDMPPSVERVYRVRRGTVDLGAEGYRIENCLASYIHLHLGSCPEMAVNFVENCRKYKEAH